jgi:hypothetical protein
VKYQDDEEFEGRMCLIGLETPTVFIILYGSLLVDYKQYKTKEEKEKKSVIIENALKVKQDKNN